jgi:predicted transcriptional regulator
MTLNFKLEVSKMNDFVSAITVTKREEDLKRLMPRHYKIAELAAEGYSNKDIAQALGISQRQVTNITGSPLFQEELSRCREKTLEVGVEDRGRAQMDALEYLRQNSLRAAEKTVELLDSENEKIALSSATEILNRVTKNDNMRSSVILDGDAIGALFRALQETKDRRKVQSEVIDSE